MTNFTTHKTFLFPPYTIDVKEEGKLFDFLRLLDDSDEEVKSKYKYKKKRAA